MTNSTTGPHTGPTLTIEGMGDRGVSDALGFVFVFSLIAATVGIVYASGFQSLNNAREFERMSNAERAFDVLQANIEDITQRGAPSRATEIKLSDAGLEIGDPIEINVTAVRDGHPTKRFELSGTVDSEPIIFDAGQDDAVIYSMGATFRRSGAETVMTNPPGMILTSEQLYLPIIRTNSGDSTAVSGDVTVLVRTELSTSAIWVSNTTETNVTLNISSPRVPAWRTYLEDNGATCPGATNTDTFLNCEFDQIPQVVIVYYSIDYRYVD